MAQPLREEGSHQAEREPYDIGCLTYIVPHAPYLRPPFRMRTNRQVDELGRDTCTLSTLLQSQSVRKNHVLYALQSHLFSTLEETVLVASRVSTPTQPQHTLRLIAGTQTSGVRVLTPASSTVRNPRCSCFGFFHFLFFFCFSIFLLVPDLRI